MVHSSRLENALLNLACKGCKDSKRDHSKKVYNRRFGKAIMTQKAGSGKWEVRSGKLGVESL